MARILLAIGIGSLLLMPGAALPQAKVTRNVSPEALEKILQGLDIKYQKGERKDKEMVTAYYYDFTSGGMPTRLYNYRTDLWLESTKEQKLKLEEVNRWNADAKFSRLVLIEQNDKTIVSLESQLDCTGGVTEGMIKQFLRRFNDEGKKFAKFVK